MPISTEMKVRVSHADILLGNAFHQSVAFWQRGETVKRPWRTFSNRCGALLIGKHDGVVIEGDCSNGVAAPDGGVIHVHGNLASTINVSGFYEIVITGDVFPEGLIEASGFCHVYVGGSFSGELRSSGSTKLWIDSAFDGTIRTGQPSTTIYIGKDCNGTVLPKEAGSLLSLIVDGFASTAFLTAIVDCEYTVFDGSIRWSDVPPGIYPAGGWLRKTNGGNSFNRWCVRALGKQLDTSIINEARHRI